MKESPVCPSLTLRLQDITNNPGWMLTTHFRQHLQPLLKNESLATIGTLT